MRYFSFRFSSTPFFSSTLWLGGATVVLASAPICAQTRAQKYTPIHLRIGGKEAFFKNAPVTDGNTVYVPLEILHKLGLHGKIKPGGDLLTLSPPTRAETVELELVTITGKKMIPLDTFARALDATVQTDAPSNSSNSSNLSTDETSTRPKSQSSPATIAPRRSKTVRTYSLLAKVLEASYAEGSFRVTTSFPVPYRVRNVTETNPQRGFVDCLGATVDSSVKVGFMAVNDGSALRIRTGQNSPEVARIVLEVADGYGLKPAESVANSSVQISSGLTSGNDLAKDHSLKPSTQVADNSTIKRGNSPDRKGIARRAMPISINALKLETESDQRIKLSVATGGKVTPHLHYTNGGNQLIVDLPNTYLKLDNPDSANLSLAHPLLQGVRAEQIEMGSAGSSAMSARLTLDLNRVVGFGVSADSRSFTLDLRLPKNAGGTLAGKLIVIDPGHGGSSTGALGGNSMEKNITLAISLKLRAVLESYGARVVMTRDNDTDVDLYARPRMANELRADLFVSIHNDSFTSNVRGTTTYYHKGDQNAHALALAVQREIMAVSGIPSKGALSDGVLYQNGLAVLRDSRMPAILVEVAYISNFTDRSHLLDPNFQSRIAAAITRGVRAYVEGNPNTMQNGDSARNSVTPAEEAAPMETLEKE